MADDRVSQDSSVLSSTPSSSGLAAASQHLGVHGVDVSDLKPWILQDVSNAQKVETDVFLAYLIQRASLNPDNHDNNLLATCFHEVLPLCDKAEIRDGLNTYATSKGEVGLYGPFISASNTALGYLHGLEINGMRTPKLNMFFERNDPKYLEQNHSGKKSRRKPDVIILPFTDQAPSRSWKDVLSVVEFKRSGDIKLPPTKYSLGNYQPPKREFLLANVHESDFNTVDEPQGVALSGKATQLIVEGSAHLSIQEQSGSSLKRPLQSNVDSQGSKRTKIEDTSPAVQTALYAVEMFAANLVVNHVINFTISNDILWMWYYDRQGIIQVGGLNFVQDLPRFLVLLYALQRFNLSDWGRNEAFTLHESAEKNTIKEHTIVLKQEEESFTFTLNSSSGKRVKHLAMKGRATDVMEVSCDELRNKLGPIADSMVVKLYWGEEARLSEVTILEEVMKVNSEDVKGHVPYLLFSYKFPISTSSVRKALGFDETASGKGSRKLLFLVFPKLWPIKELKRDELYNAWCQCVLCHYVLWKEGIYHRDISCENLMYYREGDSGVVVGVLNDYDLASLRSSANPLGNERTGTIPFMAIDLLSKNGQDGRVEHLYRHDMESFIWVLVWISVQYVDGERLFPGPLDGWAQVNASGCVEKKLRFLDDPQLLYSLSHNRTRVIRLLTFLSNRQNARANLIKDLNLILSSLNDARVGPSSPHKIEKLEKKVKELEGELAEESDSDVFTKFVALTRKK